MYNPQQAVKGVVDIVFLIDITGSMQPCINALKRNIKTFFDSMASSDSPITDWRAKIVGFRDYEEDPQNGIPWFEDNSFTTDRNELFRQLDVLKAKGGGDTPESLLDAIYTVVAGPQSDDPYSVKPDEWRDGHTAARAIIAFTDAPFKDPMAAPGCAGGTANDVREALKARRVIFTLIAPRGIPDDSCFRWADQTGKGGWIPIQAGPDGNAPLDQFMKDKEGMSRLLDTLGKTLSGTVSGLLL